MAKSLKTLIRIREWNVDEKKRELGIKLSSLTLLEKKSLELQQELEREQEYVVASPEVFGFCYENYGREVARKQGEINKDIFRVNNQIKELRSDLNDAYRELKKLDVIAKKRAAEVDREIKRREQNILDDLGVVGFLKKKC